ncbi:uncharacterized protein LOC106462630 isoform X2 [Limulus polyphemus]|uniref:Uncharacterized protein LOC106462630 isoform X2 n=1 Tax=Limulus polyphemus TaxID=6850 RepID=A0ABM1SPU5_LIMPO|nr:uncharacterized protein LOC106462630 isoform X2 [Limulus polyphemus]XP_022245651.1 uncharacterized protein LOC106462630 isoform X2 [Limulus polyphemus]
MFSHVSGSHLGNYDVLLVQNGEHHVDHKSTEMEMPKMNDHLGEVIHTNSECDLIRPQEDEDDEIVSIFEVEPDAENNETENSKVENNAYMDIENKVLHTVLLKDRKIFFLGTPSCVGNRAAIVFDDSVAFNKRPVVMNITHESSSLGKNKCKNIRFQEKYRSQRITVQKNMEKLIEESIQYKSFHMHPHQKNLLAFKTKELRNHVLKLKWNLQHFREDLVCNQTSLQQTIKQTDRRLRPRSRVVYC